MAGTHAINLQASEASVLPRTDKYIMRVQHHLCKQPSRRDSKIHHSNRKEAQIYEEEVAMSYPPHGNGYGPPPNSYVPQPQNSHNGGPPQQQTPMANPQYFTQNQASYAMNDYSNDRYYPPASSTGPVQSQPQSYEQPQFISPSQLLQQAPAPSQIQQTYQQTSSIPLPTSASPQAFINPKMAPIKQAVSEVDMPMLLTSLAEEYFSAAHSIAPAVLLSMTGDNLKMYGRLIATGLGCLHTALRNVKLAPRVEAKIRLRYAAILFEETEDLMEAESTLTKGIALCERVAISFRFYCILPLTTHQNHYFDLKYAMQFLLAQFMAKKSPKASIKVIDGHISEAQA